MSIIVLADEIDVHADAIISKLYELNAEVLRINIGNVFDDEKNGLSLNVCDKLIKGEITYNNRNFKFEDIKSVLCRDFYVIAYEKADFREDLIYHERRSSLYSWFRTLDCKWVNAPWIMDAVDSKPYQYSIAKKIGIKIPATLVTNVKDKFFNFYELCNQKVIIKQLSEINLIKEDKENKKAFGFHTNKIEEKHLKEIDLLINSPCLFQQLIEKKGDIRITVIGNNIFSAFIDSQSKESTKIDFRHDDVPVKYFEFPDDEKTKLLNMMKELNLHYGAVDYVLTPDNELVFLEINTAGNYLWIEHELGLPISECIAKYLLIN
jgi:glutathione synthase/RimK-type ligase-like ATP-grasp enzyme